eukprot:jgi/Mesvir1/7831/Mv11772-RA.1
MISRHLQQYVDNNCVGGAQMDVLLEDGVDGAKRAVIRLSEMDDDKEDVNIRLKRHDDNTADCVFGSRGVADERQVFHDAAEKVVEWMMGWSNLDVRIFNRLTSDFLLRGSFKMVDRARQSRNQVSVSMASPIARMIEGALFRATLPRDFENTVKGSTENQQRFPIREPLMGRRRWKRAALHRRWSATLPLGGKGQKGNQFRPKAPPTTASSQACKGGHAPPMVESGVSFAAVTGKDEYHGGLEMVDDPVKRIQIERFERLANGTREQQFALYQDILNDKPEVAKVPYTSKRTFMPRFETLLQQELRLRRLAQNAPETVAAAPSHAAPAAVAQKRGESVHESAAVPSTARDPPATSKPVATGDMPPPRQRGRGKGVDGGEVLDVFDMTLGNLEGGGPIFGRQEDVVQEKPAQWREAPREVRSSSKRAVTGGEVDLTVVPLQRGEGKPVVRVGQISRERGLSLSKGLSEALATYKGKALKGKGKGKEVEVADAPVSLLEKWEKSPVSQDDDDILDVNDEIAKGKRLRKQLAVQPRDLDEMSKALVHRNRVWTRNLFVGPQKLLARDLHLSRAEQNATIFANSESDYGHDKLVIPVWRYSFQFLADRCPNTFHDWMKKEGTQRQLAQLFGEMGGHGQ